MSSTVFIAKMHFRKILLMKGLIETFFEEKNEEEDGVLPLLDVYEKMFNSSRGRKLFFTNSTIIRYEFLERMRMNEPYIILTGGEQ